MYSSCKECHCTREQQAVRVSLNFEKLEFALLRFELGIVVRFPQRRHFAATRPKFRRHLDSAARVNEEMMMTGDKMIIRPFYHSCIHVHRLCEQPDQEFITHECHRSSWSSLTTHP